MIGQSLSNTNKMCYIVQIKKKLQSKQGGSGCIMDGQRTIDELDTRRVARECMCMYNVVGARHQ